MTSAYPLLFKVFKDSLQGKVANMKFIPFIAASTILLSNSLAAVDIFSQIKPTKFETVAPNEKDQVATFIKIISEMQQRKSIDSSGMKRAFHAKSHGCLVGELQINSLPPSLAQGLFQNAQQKYRVLARFSNGVGFIQSDSKGDVKGFAMKVFNVKGPRLITLPAFARDSEQDFTMTNNPTPLADNVGQFVELGIAMDKGLPYGIAFLLKNLDIADIVIHRVFGRTVKTLANETFWSGSPYLLGPKQAVKWNVTPCQQAAETQPNLKDPNYLRNDLQERLRHQDLCYQLNAQLQIDPLKQPIEKHLTEWKEQDTPSIPMGKITFKRSQNQNISNMDDLCEKTNFNPWNGLRAHQPLGNMNRARGQIYLNSFTYRAQYNSQN